MRWLQSLLMSAVTIAGLTACCCPMRMGVPNPRPVVINVPQGNPFPNPDPAPPLPIAPPQPVAPPDVPGKKTIDLIPLINPALDAVDKRRWEVKNDTLHCPEGNFVPRIQIPYQPPAEYDFVVVYSQPNPRNGISMIMPNPNPNAGSFFWYIGPRNSDYGFASNPNIQGSIPNLIVANTAVTTTVQVRKTGVKGLVNGQELLNHPTNFRDLICDGWRTIPNKTLLALACDDPTVFHFVRVVEITGQGKRIR
jgi:hypothetical protein